MSVPLFVLWIAACSCGRRAPSESVDAKSNSATIDAEQTKAADLDYLERVTGGASRTDTLPMIVAVHGLGDRPENFESLFDSLSIETRVILPRAPTPYHGGGSWFDIELPMPADGESMAEGIAAAADRVASLTEALSRKRPTIGKPIICGFSQGGAISYAAAVRHPDVFAGAVPLSGAIPVSIIRKHSTGTGPIIRAAHGERDPLIPIDGARRTVEALRKAGYDVQLTEIPNLGHSVDRRMKEFVYRQLRDLVRAEEK